MQAFAAGTHAAGAARSVRAVNAQPSWSPPAPPARLRWGLGDFFWVFFGGLVASIVAGLVEFAIRYPNAFGHGQSIHSDALDAVIVSLVQFPVWFAMIALLVGRRGRGLRADLGLMLQRADWWWLFVGVGSAIGISILDAPLGKLWTDAHHGGQAIGQDLKNSAGGTRVILALIVVIVAPIVEETLFRGVLLRALLRKTTVVPAVLITGAAFALTHTLGDPSTLPAVPAFMMLGTFSAAVAVRSGNLSRSIFIHMGFNLLGAISLIAAIAPR
jgi:membrane protease YdiL (CAAX protease family)